MSFTDELINKGGLPYGMEIEQPKAHENINKEIENFSVLESIKSMPPEQMNLIQGLITGTMGGGGAGKGLKQLILALKGKIKGGKMIPSQPIRQGTIGGPQKNLSAVERKILNRQEQEKIRQSRLITDSPSSNIDNILNKVQQSERYVNYRPGFLQKLINKFKK